MWSEIWPNNVVHGVLNKHIFYPYFQYIASNSLLGCLWSLVRNLQTFVYPLLELLLWLPFFPWGSNIPIYSLEDKLRYKCEYNTLLTLWFKRTIGQESTFHFHLQKDCLPFSPNLRWSVPGRRLAIEIGGFFKVRLYE